MQIQWFPGHMKKALRSLEESVKMIDMVICVLDARAPYSCINPVLNNIMQSRPILYCINKADLADENYTTEWLDYFKSAEQMAVKIDATKPSAKKIIEEHILKAEKEKKERKNKSYNLKFRVAIVGVPNTGKSTLLNTLAGGYIAKTGNIAGVTRASSWIKLKGNIELMDNAGTLYPKFEDAITGENLAIIGSINDSIISLEDLALCLVNRLKKLAPNKLMERYKLASLPEEDGECLVLIGKKRGLIVKGGEVDLERTASTIITDYRQGKIGKITLERVGDRIK